MTPTLLGILWGGGSAFAFAFYQIANRRLVNQASVYRTTFLCLVGSVAVGVVFVFLLEEPAIWQQVMPRSILWFAISGLVHFCLGWTALSIAQRAIGAARVSPLISSSVVGGAVLGAVLFGEPFNVTLVGGVLLTIVGIYLISQQGETGRSVSPDTFKGVFMGLLAGTCFAVSPIFFRWGYAITPSSYIAAWIGLIAGAVVSGLMWQVSARTQPPPDPLDTASVLPARTFWTLQLLTGIVVGAAIFGRWISLVYLPIVDVNALNLLTIPTVVILAPLVLKQGLEYSGWQLWLGMVCMLTGIGLTLIGGL
jgi:drug/metabolite transporter (DMT)-like permease